MKAWDKWVAARKLNLNRYLFIQRVTEQLNMYRDLGDKTYLYVAIKDIEEEMANG